MKVREGVSERCKEFGMTVWEVVEDDTENIG